MEGNYLTSGDLALIENRRGYYGHDGYCDGYSRGYRRDAAGITGIGLAAGLGGGALLLAIAGIWGVNQASKARARGAENLANANTNYINQLAGFAQSERASREAWQNVHAPTTTQYVDVRTGAGAFAGAGASSYSLAQAEANLLTGALTGQYARCPQEVTLVAKQNFGCPATKCGGDCGCNG